MFIPISGILCTYFPMNGPDRGYLLWFIENSDINSLYFALIRECPRNNAFFCSYNFARVKSMRKAQAQKIESLFLLALVFFFSLHQSWRSTNFFLNVRDLLL